MQLVPLQTTPEPPRLPHDRDQARQWMSFHQADGRVLTSRQINWRNVPLAELVEVQFHIKGETWGLRRIDLPSSFLEFVVFRTGGSDLRVVQEPTGPRVEIIPFNSWSLGWTDGLTEYLDTFCWKSGRALGRFVGPRDPARFPSHFHPQSRIVARH